MAAEYVGIVFRLIAALAAGHHDRHRLRRRRRDHQGRLHRARPDHRGLDLVMDEAALRQLIDEHNLDLHNLSYRRPGVLEYRIAPAGE